MSELKLVAHNRTLTGRKVSQLRRAGLVPVIVYGNVKEPVNLQVETRSLEAMLHAGGATRVVEVTVQDGGKHNVLVKNVHREPIHHKLLHADFYAVNMSEKQRVAVPVVGVGKPSGLAAGLMQLQLHEVIHIEALPADIPSEIEIDISLLTLERPITVADLPTLQGITYVDHAEEVIFNLQHTKEGTLDEEAAAEETAEPEVVKRAKPTDED